MSVITLEEHNSVPWFNMEVRMEFDTIEPLEFPDFRKRAYRLLDTALRSTKLIASAGDEERWKDVGTGPDAEVSQLGATIGRARELSGNSG